MTPLTPETLRKWADALVPLDRTDMDASDDDPQADCYCILCREGLGPRGNPDHRLHHYKCPAKASRDKMRSYADAWAEQLAQQTARAEAAEADRDYEHLRVHCLRRMGYVKHYARSLEEAQQIVASALEHDDKLVHDHLAALAASGEQQP